MANSVFVFQRYCFSKAEVLSFDINSESEKPQKYLELRIAEQKPYFSRKGDKRTVFDNYLKKMYLQLLFEISYLFSLSYISWGCALEQSKESVWSAQPHIPYACEISQQESSKKVYKF